MYIVFIRRTPGSKIIKLQICFAPLFSVEYWKISGHFLSSHKCYENKAKWDHAYAFNYHHSLCLKHAELDGQCNPTTYDYLNSSNCDIWLNKVVINWHWEGGGGSRKKCDLLFLVGLISCLKVEYLLDWFMIRQLGFGESV